MARRIAHLPKAHAFVTGTTVHERGTTPSCFVRVYDEVTFERLDELALETSESVCSVLQCTLNGKEYVAVGTAFVHSQEPEPTQGRILLYSIQQQDQGPSKLVAACLPRVTSGAVFSLAQCGERLVAGVNARVELIELSAGKNSNNNNKDKEESDKDQRQEKELQLNLVCDHSGNVMALHLRSQGDFVLVGDLMRSMTVLRCDSVSNKLVTVARDFNPRWLTSVSFCGDGMYLSCDQNGVLRLLGRAEEADDSRLQDLGLFHIGSPVNVFRFGRLVMPDPTLANPPPEPILFGCVDGTIGAIAPLEEEEYVFFKKLEEVMSNLPSTGCLQHKAWRGDGNNPSSNFVDGDAIERYPDLSVEEQRKIAKDLDMHVSDIVQRVEDKSRSIHK